MRRRDITQFLLFLVVGGTSAGIDAGGFILLTWLGMVAWLASPVSFLASFAFNFLANRSVVFRVRPERWQIIRYTALVAVNTVISSLLVGGGVALGMSPLFAKIASMALIAMWNFVLLRFWVFKTPATVPAAPEQEPAPASEDSAGPQS